MLILKPLRIGCMTRLMPALSGRQLVVTGQICWDLLAPDTCHTDQKLWETATAEFSGSTTVLDHWVPKLRGEFLVCGKAVAPMGMPVSHLNLSVSVGALRKHIAVSGDRFWRPGLLRTHMTDAVPFLEMPITYERAFGGEGYVLNPVGMGYRAQRDVDDGKNVQLPNLQSSTRPILHQRDEPTPCALGPVDLDWPGKISSSGTFDKTWFKQRYPLPPVDFDYRVYNVAPTDQQLESGFFWGNEAICVDGMHRSEPEIRSRLPGLVMRLFVVKAGSHRLLEVPARLDTIWLFPSALKGVALYRAVVECDDADARDIDAIMLACERLDQARPIAHYEETYSLRTNEATKALYVLADDQLMPELSLETERELDAKREQVSQQRRKKWQADTEHFKAMTAALTGVAVPSAAADYMLSGKSAWLEDKLPIVLPEDIARGNVDIAGIQRTADALQQRGRDMRAAASQLVPPALREEMGFSKAEEAQGAMQGKAQIVELLGLHDVQSAFAEKAADLRVLLQRLEADPALSVPQELSGLMAKNKDGELEKMRAMIRDPKLLAFLDESEAVRIELARQTAPASAVQESPEMRASLMNEIKKMEEGFSRGILDVPQLSSPLGAMLKALGINVDPAGMNNKWPPGKIGALIQSSLQQAVERNGLAGMVELSGKLQLASLQVLPPDKQAQMLPGLERQVDYSLSEALAYKLAYPEAEKRFSEAFSKKPAVEDISLPNVADGMAQLRQVAGDVGDSSLRDRILNLIGQSEEIMSAAMDKALTGHVQDGKVDYQRFQQETAAQAIMLAGYRLPANDGLPENEWLTYDKRFAVALATAAISRLGLPLALPSMPPSSGVGAGDGAAAPSALSGLVQRGETMMRDGRRRALMAFSQVGEHEAEVAAHLGAWVQSAHRRGLSLAGRDMAGANLRDADLRGADLTGAFLERADLSGAKLDEAQCDGIVLSGALLTRTSFRHASLRKANLGQVKAHLASFVAADLSDAQLYQADLTHADCTDAVLDRVSGIECVLQNVQAHGSRCAQAQFITANLRGIELDRARWQKVVFMKGDMSGFHAPGAQLEECVWAQVNLSHGNVEDAQLRASQFNDCDCNTLRAARVQAVGACWIKGSMLRANFSLAVLDNSLFESTVLDGANFQRAKMIGATFMRASLKTVCMGQAQLMQARFHNADLSDADLRFANVHGADFSDACLDRVDFTGARRIDTLLEMPRADPV